MKKLLYTAIIAAFASMSISCSDNDDSNIEPTPDSVMTVLDITNSGSEPYTQHNIEFTPEYGTNMVDIKMNQVCFDTDMPVSLDIILPSIELVSGTAGIYSADSVTATDFDGSSTLYSRMITISDVNVICLENAMTVTFKCYFISTETTYLVKYIGKL